jgi:protein-L-isoaspartate(D-aspartate) O-methyltransferase
MAVPSGRSPSDPAPLEQSEPAVASSAHPTFQPASSPLDRGEDRDRRDHLVRELRRLGDITDKRVFEAMRAVPRHLFITGPNAAFAYENEALPIGRGQTISQPTIVAVMTEALELTGAERVLEVGTGSAYQTAILSLLAKEVFSIERVPELGERARELLQTIGCGNVTARIGDGYAGWPEHAPFDRIIVTAAPPEIPKALFDQLADGGILVTPVGDTSAEAQWLLQIRKRGAELESHNLGAVRFVPMLEGVAPEESRWN